MKNKIKNEIRNLDEGNPKNFLKLCMMNMKMANGYSSMIGKTDDDNFYICMSKIYQDTHKYFNELLYNKK